jgi:hypothetical protein
MDRDVRKVILIIREFDEAGLLIRGVKTVARV